MKFPAVYGIHFWAVAPTPTLSLKGEGAVRASVRARHLPVGANSFAKGRPAAS